MKFDVIQSSFGTGEIGPSIYGRVDILQYQNAVQIAENFLVKTSGSIISRPGSNYVATVSDSTLATRLIKFVFSSQDAYVIELGDHYARFYTDGGQLISPGGTEDLSAFADLKAHWKCNDNVSGTGTTTVLDAVTTHNGTASTITSSLSTTAIVDTGFDLAGKYHISVVDDIEFTRTASTQPMTLSGWAYYTQGIENQTFISKAGEYDISVDSSDMLAFTSYTGTTPTVLLLHMDGTDGSTTFTDSGYLGLTVTPNGNAQIDTAQSVFGGGSGLFDGSGDYLSIPDNANWTLGGGTGDFTIDCWVRFSDVSSGSTIVSQGVDGDNGWTLVYSTINGGLTFEVRSSAVVTISWYNAWTPAVNTWYHIALVRDSGVFKFAFDGFMDFTASDATAIPNFATALTVGAYGAGLGTFMKGWIEELRIVNTAVWKTDFAIPTAPYQLSGSNSWRVNSPINTGWHFFAVTFKGTGSSESDCIIYVDGSPASVTFTPHISFTMMENTPSLFRIGTNAAAGTNLWKGKVDNISLIHTFLTSTQILSLYSSSPYQIATPYASNEVFSIQYSQLNDIIYLAHPDHPPQQLTRLSSASWTIGSLVFIGGPFLDENAPPQASPAGAVTSATVKLDPVSAAVGDVTNLAVTPTNASLFTLSTSTLGHKFTYWMINGPSNKTSVSTLLEEWGYVQLTDVINSYTATCTVIKALRNSSATDQWAEGAWSSVNGYPGAVIFHQKRLYFARTNQEPTKVWGSRTFKYEDYALDTQADDDGINIGLASSQSNEILWLAEGKALVAGTFGGTFVISGGSEDSITPDTVQATEQAGFGCSKVRPVKVGSFMYYIQRFGRRLREMFFSFDIDSYKSIDRTVLAPHILGDGVVDMDVAQNPEPILYCVLTNGTLATLTREVDQEMTAWTRQSTSGTYTSIAVIPSRSGLYDEVWCIVERWVNGSRQKYVELFNSIDVPDQQYNCLYLDSALTYNAYQSTNASSVSISLSASSGSVTITSSSAYFNGGMIGKRVRAVDTDGDTVGEGTVTATASTTSITLSITTTFNSLTYASSLWGVSVSSISGLDHLETKTVGILADGLTESLTRTIASGSLTLGSNYFVISAGLSYDQNVMTLHKELPLRSGTAQGKWQRYSDIALRVNRSTQNFKYGTDASNLDDVNMAFTPTVTSLYSGIIPSQAGGIAMRGGNTRGATIYIRNSQPLPLEILNVMGSLDTYEG